LSRANSSAHAELSSIDTLPVSAIGLRMVAAANLVEVAALVTLRERRCLAFSYYRIATPVVATMLESIKVVAAIEVPSR
jgi:hypothetical protein